MLQYFLMVLSFSLYVAICNIWQGLCDRLGKKFYTEYLGSGGRCGMAKRHAPRTATLTNRERGKMKEMREMKEKPTPDPLTGGEQQRRKNNCQLPPAF
ncbi:hypothetical protein [Nostoc sp. NIES-3756]|uniref:hypothetical protein n=1 Tax=Nostoc sp. NIES-3756 TaxID=1751286 RepID=UPI000832CE24|nr:hypothetical protein [Nostoc sp. NIES-3756]